MLISICDGDPSSESRRIGRDTSHELDLHVILLLAVAPSRPSTAVLVGALRQRALHVTTMANQENAARQRGRLLPSCAAGLMALSGDGSVSVSSPDPSRGEGFAFASACPDSRLTCDREGPISASVAGGDWMVGVLRRALASRSPKSRAPLLSNTVTRPCPSAAAAIHVPFVRAANTGMER